MGFKWKQLSERTKQAFGLGGHGKDWKPTSNARNEAMISEAKKFSKQLKALYHDLEALEAKVDGSFGVMKSVLNSHLPRVYATSAEGTAVPADTDAGNIGTGVNFHIIDAASKQTKDKLRNEVLHPLDQWLIAYRTIKLRNKKCEAVRLELDAKRRLATRMHVGYERQKTKVTKSGADSVPEATVKTGETSKLEHAEYKLQTEEDKAARLTQRFKDIEQEVFNALLTLIKDTAVLRQYAAAALVVMENCFQQAYAAFDLNTPLAATNYVAPAETTTSYSKPEPGAAGAAGVHATPDWYTEARNNATAQNYDSEDEH